MLAHANVDNGIFINEMTEPTTTRILIEIEKK